MSASEMGLLSPCQRRRQRRLRRGAFGHGGVPRFLAMQLDHRRLALFVDVGPQACALALLGEVDTVKMVWLPTMPATGREH
jgi:hypothetical protein